MSTPYPLGRLVEHDERSRGFAHPTAGGALGRSVLWARHSPILDQGSLGSCTGNAMSGWLGCEPHCTSPVDAARYDEEYAIRLYSLATKLDRYPGTYPPDDTGSSGLAVAKAARRLGDIRSYSWAFSVMSLLSALQHGPVIVGVPWYDDMFAPDSSGEVHIGGNVAGGHEFLIRGWDAAAKLLHCDNSWGTSWGDGGSFRLSLDTWIELRRQDADVTVPHV